MSAIPTQRDLDRLAKRKARRGRPVKPSKSEEGRFRRAMTDIWKEVLFPGTDRLQQMIKAGANPAEIAEEIERILYLANGMYGRLVDNIVGKWMLSVDRDVRIQIMRTIKSGMGLDLSAVLAQPDVSNAMAMAGLRAANLIKTIPGEYLGKVAEAVADNFSGTPLPEGRSLLEQIQHIGGVSYRRAKLIARDQTSKLTASLNQHRQEAIGIECYYWRTVRDQRVVGNPEGLSPTGNSKHGDHYHMEGMLCRWSDVTVYSDDDGKTWKKRPATWSHRHPGEDIQCRCFAEPKIEPDKIISKMV